MLYKLKYFNYKRILAVLLLLFISSMYFYSDSVGIIRFGIDFWNALFSGRFFQMSTVFVESQMSGKTLYSDGYGIVTTFFLAIWQFPLFLIEHFFKVNVMCFFVARIWGKLYLIILGYLCAKEIEKISLEITGDEVMSGYAFWLFLFNPFTISAVCVIGQADIIGVFFSLLALKYLYRNNRKLFFTFFILASSIKYYPLIFFIPVILLYEKRIWKSFMLIVSPIAFNYLCNLPFKIMGEKSFSEENIEQVYTAIFDEKIRIVGFEIPVIITLFCGVCISAFLTQNKDDEKNITWSLWYIVLSILSVFRLFTAPYRIVLLVPFVILLLLRQKANSQEYIIEAVAMSSLMAEQAFKWHPMCFEVKNLSNMLIDFIIPLKDFKTSGLGYYGAIIPDGGLFAIFWVCAFTIGVRFCPLYNRESLNDCNSVGNIKTVLILRNVLGIVLPCAAVFLYLLVVVKRLI